MRIQPPERYVVVAFALVMFFASSASPQTAQDPDVNDDGVVNVLDVSLITSCLGPVVSSVCAPADIDGNGSVTMTDFDVVVSSFGTNGYPRCGDGIVNRSTEVCDGASADACGNGACSTACLCAPLTIQITSPASLLTVGATPLPVTGVVNSGSAVVTLNGVVVNNNGGAFTGSVDLEQGHNTIVARAVDGGRQTTDSISVSLDLTPPYLTIDSHEDGQEVFATAVTITGLINDIVRGTIEQDDAQVTVNGRTASISNRSYAAVDVPLSPGENLITVIGRDQVGNTATKVIRIKYSPPQGRRLEIVSGQGQVGEIGAVLAQPLSVRVLDDAQTPVPAASVIFRVVQGSGVVLEGTSTEERAAVVAADSNGVATATFRLGSRSGSANHKVRAQVVGYETEAIFYASATNKIGNKISVNSGNNQRGAVGQALPEPFVVSVTDDGANVVQGARVSFAVTKGDGILTGGGPTFETQTDGDGRATAELTLGALEGIDAQRVTATLIDGPPGETITAGFSATAFVPADPGQTTITGVVLDNQDKPLPNVTIRVEGSARQDTSDEAGRFEITEAPIGPVHLIADGSTTTAPGEYPSLSFNLVTVPGVENPLPSPIYMVKLDTASAVLAGPSDVSIELAKFPGFKLEIAAGSVTFPDGSKEGLVSVTPVNASKVPMPPPNGMQPQFIVTIQPTNTMFDPPARLSLPNVDAHPPGAQVEMYSYDHDLEEFVSIGLGTVSEDGSVIRSNPGVGVVKAGWHCGSQPEEQGCANGCAVCQEAGADCSCTAVADDPRVSSLDAPGDCKVAQCTNGAVEQAYSANDSPANKCKECRDGGLQDIQIDTTSTSISYTYGFPNEAVTKINDALEELSRIGVLASVNLTQVTGSLASQECCGETTGKSTKREGSVSGNFGGFDVKGKIWPPGPIPTFGPLEIDVWGVASLEVEAQFVGGIFLGLSGSVVGQLGFRADGCSASSQDRSGCAFANLQTTLTPSLTAEIGGTGSIAYDCIFCTEATISVIGQLLIGGLSWQLAISDVSYNKTSCGSGLSGGLFAPGAGSFKISATFSGSWEPDGGGVQSINVTREFLSCEITTATVQCN